MTHKITSLCAHSVRRFLMATKAIKTFVFLDSETTGLPTFENNKTRITELTMCAVQSDHISLGVYPRVQNKINLCFHPQKLINADSERMTGLSNHLLEYQAPFGPQTVNLIKEFLRLLRKPVCFVAHNGNGFDYPILRAEIQKTKVDFPNDILCVDSLEALRAIEKEQQEPSTSSCPSNDIPLEFQDNYSEILANVLEDIEKDIKLPKIDNSLDGGAQNNLSVTAIEQNPSTLNDDCETSQSIASILTPCNTTQSIKEIQRINETTPKKSSLVSNGKWTKDMNQKAIPESPSIKEFGKNRGKSVKRHLDYGVSFKLGDVYERITGHKLEDAHKAECDVDALIRIAATLGERFVEWAQNNSKLFTDIPPMTPGKKIGTS